MLSLDIRTLSFLAMVSSLLLAVGLQLVHRIIANDPSLRLWALGASASGAGYVLFAVRGIVPDLLSIVVGNTLLIVGATWLYQGNQRYRGVQNEPPWYWFVVAATATELYYFTYLVPSLSARIVALSAATAAVLLPSALVLLHPGDSRDRMVRWFVAAAYLATALFLGARAVITPFMASPGQDFMTVVSPVHTFSLVFAIGLNVVLGIGLPLLVSGRMQRQLLESEVQLTGILESTADGILAVDRDGKVLRSNEKFAKMWRIPQSLLDSKDDQALLNYVVEQLHDPDAFLTKVHSLYQSGADDSNILRFNDGREFEHNSSPLILNSVILGRVWSFRDVTKRMQAEEALNASEARFRSLTDLGSGWYWEQDEHLRFKEMSGGLGYCASLLPAEHIGKTRWEIPYVDMDDAVWQRHREQLERHESFRDFEIKRPDRDGNLCIVSVSGEPVFDAAGRFAGYRGVGSDITERKLNQQRIERLLAERKSMLENDLIGIVTVRNRSIVWANPAFEKMLGYAPGELAGMPTRRNYPSDEAYMAFGAAAYPVLAAGNVFRSQFEHVRKDGKHIWVDASGSMLDLETGDSLWGFVDITERK